MDAKRKQLQLLLRARRPLPPPEQRAEVRKAARLRLQDLADLLGVTVSTVGNWERGKCEPKAAHYEDYRSVLEDLASKTT